MIGKKVDDPVMDGDETQPASLFDAGEQRPTVPPKAKPEPVASKVRSIFGGPKKEQPSPAAPSKEVKPKVTHRREPLADLLGLAWGGMGTALVRGPDVPVGRAMQAQSPVAGEILDNAIKGTVIDKALQPLARKADQAQALFGLLGVPLLVGAIERYPAMAPAFGPLLYSAVETWVVEMAPIMRKRQQRAEKVKKTVAEAFPDLPDGVDPVAMLIDAFFAPPDGEDVSRETSEEKVPA
jgi:hypothetical protein